MPASLNDQAILAANVLFTNRVKEGLVATCIAVTTEAATTAYHYKRANFAITVLNSFSLASGSTQWPQTFALGVSTDANVIADATVAGTVVLTTGNIDVQQALVTDAHINAALSGQFNSFFNPAA